MKKPVYVSSAVTILLTATISIGNCAQSDAGTGSGAYCKQTSFGACRSVHGRYGIYVENNGIVDLRMRQLLSTAGAGELDTMIRAAGDEFDYEVFGQFVVCPTSAYRRPGPMRSVQSVCVQSYKNAKVVKTNRK